MLENQIVRKSSENEVKVYNRSHEGFVGPQTPIYTDYKSAVADFDSEIEGEQEQQNDLSINQHARISMLLANAQVLMKHSEFHLALNLLRQASNQDSKNLNVLKMLEKCLVSCGRDSEALIVSKNIAKIRPSYSSLNAYAGSLYKAGNDQQALETYYSALSHLKNETEELFETYKTMGNIYVKTGDFEAAEELYNKAYTLNPQSDVLLVNLGTLEVQRSDFDKSLYCFRKAVELNPRNEKAWVGLAMVHNHFGDRELAWANIDAALDVNSANRTAVHLAANWGVRDAQISKSIEILKNYLGQVEQDEDMSLVLINLLCSIGDLETAMLEMNRVLLWNPANTEVKNLLKTLKNNQRV